MKLKPCPFCGHQPRVLRTKEYPISWKAIKCSHQTCTVQPVTFSDMRLEAVMEMWNTRRRQPADFRSASPNKKP